VKRVRIIVRGKVQKVGYRTKVKNIAGELGVKGEVSNLPEGAVEIIAEGEKHVLDKFIKEIKIKNELINVQGIIFKFEDATGEFKAFTKVVREEKKETHERLDSAVEYLKELIVTVKSGDMIIADKIDTSTKVLGGKQDKMLEKQDETIAAIKGLDKKQDVMIEKQDATVEAIKGLDKKQDVMIGKQDVMIGKQEVMIDTLKGFREESKQSFYSLNKNLTGFREETKNEFQIIKTDYGRISQDLGKAVDSINRIAKSIETLAKAIAEKK